MQTVQVANESLVINQAVAMCAAAAQICGVGCVLAYLPVGRQVYAIVEAFKL